jgi:hypothetical protein
MEKVVFLDIDGVLQPGWSQKRFEHTGDRYSELGDMPELYKELYEKYGVDYAQYDRYDVAAVYYDWDKEAVTELKRILDVTGAKIVISSSWRESKTLSCLADFFRLYDMAEYVVDGTPIAGKDPAVRERMKNQHIYNERSAEILEYVDRHPEIKKWITIDDMRMDDDLGEHAVLPRSSSLEKEEADKCIEVLS